MRCGLNTFLDSPGFTDADFSLIDRYKGYGAEVIELAVVEPSAVSVPDLRSRLQAAGLPEPIVCGAFGGGRDLRGESGEVQKAITYIDEMIDLARVLGAKVVCGPMYSEVGHARLYSAEERHSQLNRIAESLRPLCEKASKGGITLALEPLNRYETDCINTIEQALDLIERVGHPALKIHIDSYHMHIEEADMGAAIRLAGSHIGHVHASASHRGLLGEDQVNWPVFFDALAAIDYQGAIALESFSRSNPALAKATSIWRTLYESTEEFATKGISFLKSNRDRILLSMENQSVF